MRYGESGRVGERGRGPAAQRPSGCRAGEVLWEGDVQAGKRIVHVLTPFTKTLAAEEPTDE